MLGYERINQDILKTFDKCKAAVIHKIETYQSTHIGCGIVIDNTNIKPDIRIQWTAIASKYNIPVSL